MKNKHSERQNWFCILGAIVIPRLVTLVMPILATDEAIYATFARAILNGAVPYRDLVDYKPPLIFYFYSLAFWLGGDGNMALVHFFHIGVVAAMCAVIFRVALYVTERSNAWLAAIFYAVFSATWDSSQFLATNGEVLMVLPLSLAVLCLWRSDEKPFSKSLMLLMASGFCLGTAFLTKYTAGISIFLTLAYLGLMAMTAKSWSGWWAGLLKGVSLIAGIMVPLLMLWAYFVSKGAWRDFYFWGWDYNHSYISQGAALLTWDYFLLKLVARTGLLMLVGWALIFGMAMTTVGDFLRTVVRKVKDGAIAMPLPLIRIGFVVLWFFVSFIPVSMGGRFFFHYYIQLLPPLCLLAAICAPKMLTQKWGKPVMIGLCVIPLALFMTESAKRYFKGEPVNYKQVAQYIADHSNQSESIFVWGYAPSIYYFADRPAASRFVFAQFLTGSFPKTNGMDFDPKKPEEWPNALSRVGMEFTHDQPARNYDTSENIVPGAWDMLFDDFARNKPAFIVDTAPANIDRYGKYPISKFPQFQAYVQNDYVLVATIAHMDIYQLKQRIVTP